MPAPARPPASYRVRRRQRRAAAQESWPRIIEEIRILTVVARPVGAPGPVRGRAARRPTSLRPAFEAAQREWLLSTDFERTVAVLKAGLADPTADAACETLLVAHEVGGADLDRRLEALDRGPGASTSRAARTPAAKQAGVRFARRFVLLVPCGHGVRRA